MRPTVTIVIPVYDRTPSIESVIESLKRASLGPLDLAREIVFVEDGSSEGPPPPTPTAARRRLRAWRLPPLPQRTEQRSPALPAARVVSPDWWKQHEYLLQYG
jgi:hypothetical protein